MYLSRVEIDLSNRRKIKDLTHLGAYHNWVEQSFPNEKRIKNHGLRHLWRIDSLSEKNYLLVLSEDKPDLKKLERYGVSGTGESKNYDQFLEQLQVGQKMAFRLTANPSKKISVLGQKQGRVVPHITIEQQKNWLLDRTSEHGFNIIGDSDNKKFDIVNRKWLLLRHKGSGTAKLSCVTFEGMLEITDLDKFKNSLIKGIGREKAYGMGLLTVIPR